MSRHFSFRRFGLLFKKHVAEQYRAYLMSFIVLTGLLMLVLGLTAYLQYQPLGKDIQEFLYVMPLLLAGAVFTSQVFATLGENKTAIAYLTLPASHFEKYLLSWLFSYVVFMVLYSISFYAVLSLVLSMDDMRGQEIEMINIFSGRLIRNVVGIYAMVHAVTLLGAIYFKKGHFIKTAFAFFVFMLVLVFLNEQLMELVLNRDVNAIPFGKVSFLENDRTWSVTPPDAMNIWINKVIPMVLALILWLSAYARLRERQV